MLLVTQKLWPVITDSNFTYPAWISILDNHRISIRYPYWISIGYPYLDIHGISTLGYTWDIHTWISMGYPYLDIHEISTLGYTWDNHTWIPMGYPNLDIRGTFGYFKYPARLTSIQISSSPLKPGITDP